MLINSGVYENLDGQFGLWVWGFLEWFRVRWRFERYRLSGMSGFTLACLIDWLDWDLNLNLREV